MDPFEIQLQQADVEQSTLLFGILALVLLIPLLLVLGNTPVRELRLWLLIAAVVFWSMLALIFVVGYWDLYYAFFYPTWMRWLSPLLTPALYAMITFLSLHLAARLPGVVWVWWLLLGATEGVAEHLLGIYGLHILERVPWLEGLRTGPILLFAFFEYLFYWALVGWLALGLRAVFNQLL